MYSDNIVSIYIKVNVITISTYTIKEFISKTIKEPSLKKATTDKNNKTIYKLQF